VEAIDEASKKKT